jgi:hypothetical protein
MRAIRRLLMLVILGVAGVLAYNYWTGNGWTLTPTSRIRHRHRCREGA